MIAFCSKQCYILRMENNNSGGQNKIIAAIIVAGVLIAGAILLKDSTPPEKALNNEVKSGLNSIAEIRPIASDEHILGNPNAEVFIVEYSDTECPYCKMFHNTMHEVVADYNGKVAWVYRHYPIPQLHQRAFNEAVATECAWEQGGNNIFWQYTDEVYSRTTSNDGLDPLELTNIATSLGLDVNAFNACLSSQKYADKVENDIFDGKNVDINGTPNSFIVKNGVVVDTIAGAAPLSDVRLKIDRALK